MGVTLVEPSIGQPLVTRSTFAAACTAAAVVAAALSVVLLVAPAVVHAVLGIEAGASADVLARRAAFLFAGTAVLLWLVRDEQQPGTRRAVAASACTAWGGSPSSAWWSWSAARSARASWLPSRWSSRWSGRSRTTSERTEHCSVSGRDGCVAARRWRWRIARRLAGGRQRRRHG